MHNLKMNLTMLRSSKLKLNQMKKNRIRKRKFNKTFKTQTITFIKTKFKWVQRFSKPCLANSQQILLYWLSLSISNVNYTWKEQQKETWLKKSWSKSRMSKHSTNNASSKVKSIDRSMQSWDFNWTMSSRIRWDWHVHLFQMMTTIKFSQRRKDKRLSELAVTLIYIVTSKALDTIDFSSWLIYWSTI